MFPRARLASTGHAAFGVPALLAALLAAAALALAPLAAGAQAMAFGGLRADVSAPVEVSAESLSVDQADGTARFSGNVVVGQGAMRLSAAEVIVEYDPANRGRILNLHASGGVTLVSAEDAAEAREAVYAVEAGTVLMTGDVLLTQGQNVLSGQRLRIDLQAGTAAMEGGVRSIFTPSGGSD